LVDVLLDVLTLAMIIRAKNDIAAKQFLRELTYRPQHAEVEGVSDYPKMVVLKAVSVVGVWGQGWLEGLF